MHFLQDLMQFLTNLGPVYTKHQYEHCDDASDTAVVENNGVTPEWGCNPFSSNSIIFNENSIS